MLSCKTSLRALNGPYMFLEPFSPSGSMWPMHAGSSLPASLLPLHSYRLILFVHVDGTSARLSSRIGWDAELETIAETRTHVERWGGVAGNRYAVALLGPGIAGRVAAPSGLRHHRIRPSVAGRSFASEPRKGVLLVPATTIFVLAFASMAGVRAAERGSSVCLPSTFSRVVTGQLSCHCLL